jgi:hypothetical protein
MKLNEHWFKNRNQFFKFYFSLSYIYDQFILCNYQHKQALDTLLSFILHAVKNNDF